MADLIADLAEFLDRATRTRFAWGSHDCCLFPADWVLSRRGEDGAARWRGRYRTAVGCKRILAREGGVVAVMALGAAAVGLAETATPGPGAIGALNVMTPQGLAQAGGIRTAIGWAVLSTNGLIVARATPLQAWEV
jgi:hypothetical protein